MMYARIRLSFFAVLVAVLLPWSLTAQDSNAGRTDTQPPEVVHGGYAIHQSIELGYRFLDRTGSDRMYGTLVDLNQGPRILEQSLSMRAEKDQGLLFDNLWVSSFGWGGDPENVLRARLDKAKWYRFQGAFRRDHSSFDYDLLGNPLNPTTSVPAVEVLESPHLFSTTRRMSDLDLTLLPQSRVSVRLGYSRNNMTGTSFSSIHEGTDALLDQPWNTTTDFYRLGVDFRAAPRTVLSYDQFFSYYKGDTSWQLGAFESGLLAGGQSVELGLPFNTAANQPCAAPFLPTGEVNPTCNGYFSYARSQRTRTSFRTEQLSLRSNYFQRLDLTALFSYSDGSLEVPAFDERFAGLISRTRGREFETSGSDAADPVSVNAEFSATLHLTSRLRLVDRFRFDNFRNPGMWNQPTVTLFGATLASTPNVFDPALCPPPFTAATCPQHSASSGADVIVDVANTALKQDRKANTVELQYDVAPKVMARAGYRFQTRDIVHSVLDVQQLTFYPTLSSRGGCLTPGPDGVCISSTEEEETETFDIDAHSLVWGVSARLSGASRVTYDGELIWADDVVTRISPRRESRNRVQAAYSPRPWIVLGGSLNLLQDSNGDSQTDYRSHFRNYGFTVSVSPRERLSADLAYNYSDILQNALICFNDTPPAGVVLPIVTNATACTDDPGNPLRTDSYYESGTHFGMGSVMVRPLKRLTTRVGYSITSVNGKTPQFNILQPLGSLSYNYHQPLASMSVDLGHNLAWNAGWNYYQYKEKSFVGPTDPRYFHANTATLSLRWEF